jgi:GNAT superfamily N-acetyltransferase
MFREAQPDDLDAVRRLYRQLNPDDPVLEDGSDARAFEAILAGPGLHLFLLERDGVAIATTYLNLMPNMTRSAAPYGVIENVVVEKELRGTGVGKEIMRHTLDVAWAAGCYKVMLMTGSRRPSTLAFYEACGFSRDAKTAFLARP